jgi:hypothetical protein
VTTLPEPPKPGSKNSIDDFFRQFGFIYALTSSEQPLRLGVRRVVQDFAADGVVYLELRSVSFAKRRTPSHCSRFGKMTDKFLDNWIWV